MIECLSNNFVGYWNKQLKAVDYCVWIFNFVLDRKSLFTIWIIVFVCLLGILKIIFLLFIWLKISQEIRKKWI